MFPAHLCVAIAILGFAARAAESAAENNLKRIKVRTTAELRAAIASAKPGTMIEIAPGEYEGGLYAKDLRGEKDKPIVLTAEDAKNPPHFSGGATGIHLSNPVFVELRDLKFSGCTANGVSLDDGGQFSAKNRGIVLRGLRIANIGARGNQDGIKLSGIAGFRVENCEVERWGSGSGSAIDMVGCHDGLIVGNRFRHVEALQETGGSGVQAKGGSSRIVIRENRFEHAGQRALNIGGSTGLPFFRPMLDRWPKDIPLCEARDIVAEGNTLIGSLSPVCFVGVDGATVRFNTIYQPAKWPFRILQENKQPGFVACRNGIVSDNLIVFTGSSGAINIGGETAPGTFRFARNHWYCIDRPERSRPELPSEEDGGVYGVDPQFENAETLDLRIKAGSKAQGKGAQGIPNDA
jgi:Right handed beta helix region